MGVFIGGYDLLKVMESLLNVLIQKNLVTLGEAKAIINSGKAK